MLLTATGGSTLTEIFAEIVPEIFCAVMVCAVIFCTVEGVPEISQLALFKVSPVGKGGVLEHDVMVPLKTGTIGVIGFPLTKVNGEPANAKPEGGAIFTVIIITEFVEPKPFVTVMVCAVRI